MATGHWPDALALGIFVTTVVMAAPIIEIAGVCSDDDDDHDFGDDDVILVMMM